MVVSLAKIGAAIAGGFVFMLADITRFAVCACSATCAFVLQIDPTTDVGKSISVSATKHELVSTNASRLIDARQCLADAKRRFTNEEGRCLFLTAAMRHRMDAEQAAVQQSVQENADFRAQLRARIASAAQSEQQLAEVKLRLSYERKQTRTAAGTAQQRIDDLRAQLTKSDAAFVARIAVEDGDSLDDEEAAAAAAASAGSKRKREVIDLSGRKRGRHGVTSAAANASSDLDGVEEENEVNAQQQPQMEDLNSLRAEVRQLAAKNEELTPVCRVCLDAPPSVFMLPCKHICLCDGCFDRMQTHGINECPTCSVRIKKVALGVKL